MKSTLRIALTADLHWGIRPRGDEATQQMIEFLRLNPPDVLVLGGDIGAGKDFAPCLGLFRDLPCTKALIPGNHDIWVEANDPRGDSLDVYRTELPSLCSKFDFHYLDQGPLLLPEADLALVGSINWYDYSWSIEKLREQVEDWEERLRTKRFSRGRHNDGRFVRMPLDDARFTAELLSKLERHVQEAAEICDKVIVITHHPPFYGLSFPRPLGAVTLDGLLWDAFSGNQSLEAWLARNAERIPFAFCGHTHRERESTLGATRGYNIGGDYHFKRLLFLDWPGGKVEGFVFGDPIFATGS
jgi:predicted phosphohydrolase